MDYITKDGKTIYYEVIDGDSGKKTLVFLNGVMASTSSWVNQYIDFKKLGYNIVLHDFIGQLKSDKFEGEYTFEGHVEDLRELLENIGVDAPHLIGTSYGGEVAMKYATMYPEEVQSITVIDSVSEVNDKMVRIVEEWIDLASMYDGETFFYGMLPSIYGYNFIKNNKELLAKRAKAMNKNPKDYFDGQIGLYKTFINDLDLTNELSKITCPALIVCGKEDTLKPVEFSQIIADRIENSTFKIIADCGHVTIFEKPEELNRYIEEFLQSI